jgi:hypothetical protein
VSEKKPEVIKEQKITSKQKKEEDKSFQIETTSMEAIDEPSKPAPITSVAPAKTPSPAQKKVVKKEEKKKEKESHDFVIETTTATP